MKGIKKILIFLILITLSFSLTSCFVVGGNDGLSAYEIAVKNGFEGTEAEWLESLKGNNGNDLKIEDVYEAAVKEGYKGSLLEFIKEYFSDTKITGQSAYELAVELGFEGSKEEWIASLKGETGPMGETASADPYLVYQRLIEEGLIDCSYLEFVEDYLKVNGVGGSSNEFIISSALRSSVSIIAASQSKDNWANKDVVGQAGAGVIYKLNRVKGEAYIITNFHVVYDSDETKNVLPYIYIGLYGAEYADSLVPATYVGGSATYDIAVLKVTGSDRFKSSDVKEIEVFNSNNLVVGTTAIAIGNPEGNGIAVTEGIVSVDSEYIDMTPIKTNGVSLNTEGKVSMRVIRIDTPVNSGNSGGGLYNDKGQLIGIVNAKIMRSNVENIGYAIPSTIATFVAQNIIDHCDGVSNTELVKQVMGITVKLDDSKAVYDEVTGLMKVVETVKVEEVATDSKAYGKLQKGDVYVSITINGVKYDITRQFILIDACLTARSGDIATIVVLRNGVEHSYDVGFMSSSYVG